MDLKVSYYIHFADHLLKAKGEEVFRRVVQEGVDAYINNWKRKEAAEEKAYELKKQAEKLEALRERMKQHKAGGPFSFCSVIGEVRESE